MIVIVNKHHLQSNRAYRASEIPLHELDYHDIIGKEGLAENTFNIALLVIVVDYEAGMFRVFKDMYHQEDDYSINTISSLNSYISAFFAKEKERYEPLFQIK